MLRLGKEEAGYFREFSKKVVVHHHPSAQVGQLPSMCLLARRRRLRRVPDKVTDCLHLIGLAIDT